ncbi:hypothetical protein GC167_02030 [bacterium]|nr:hypothetical protein [bacterium]
MKGKMHNIFTRLLWAACGMGWLTSAAQSNLNQQLAGHWSFDQGNAVADVGSANGTLVGAQTTADRFGCPDRALYLDGNGAHVKFGNILGGQLSGAGAQFSIGLWVRPDSVHQDAALFSKFSQSPCGSNQRSLQFKSLGGAPALTTHMGNGAATQYRTVGATNPIPAGQWTHLLLVFDGAQNGNDGADRVQMYVNGMLQSTSLLGGAGVLSDVASSNAQIVLGGVLGTGGAFCSNAFRGALDDFRIYDRLLDATEALALAQNSECQCLGLGPIATACPGDPIVLRPAATAQSSLWSTGSIADSLIVHYPDSGWFGLTAILPGGCIATDSVWVRWLVPPVQPNLGPDRSICTPNSALLEYNEQADSIRWSDGTSGAMTVAATSGTYWVEVFLNGCSASDTIEMTEFSHQVSLGEDRLMCKGGTYTLQYQSPEIIDSVRWSTGATTTDLTVTAPGIYHATVYARGCPASDTVVIGENEGIELDLGKDTTLCAWQFLILSVEQQGDVEWSTGETGHTIIVNKTGNYWVELTDSCGVHRDTIRVQRVVCDDPLTLRWINAFSPNADGVNDEYEFHPIGDWREFKLEVYSKIGLKVFESNDPRTSWNGKMNNTGEECPMGTYAVKVYLKDYDTKLQFHTGTVTVLR